MLAIFTIEHEQVLRTDLNNSEIRYTKNYVFSWQGVCTHPTHPVCLRHWLNTVCPSVRSCENWVRDGRHFEHLLQCRRGR